MDQQKIGLFLKELRKEKELTQEQLADKLFVSRRTVSRWETGSNMPDMEMLIELADLYDVELREILNGERKAQMVSQEIRETAILTSEYENAKFKKLKMYYHIIYIITFCFGLLSVIIEFKGLTGSPWDFWRGYGLGMTLVGILLGVIFTSKLTDNKDRTYNFFSNACSFKAFDKAISKKESHKE
ncbi:MAG: helix-turn-helix transcriptional regulator [Clostridia bacterium]|nr:helix-turn-helix transcriptional regulator [Clostridia bacterium]